MIIGPALAAMACLAAAPAAQAALTTVPQRTALETNRIDSPKVAALPDGRVLLGWTNGTNSGDTTLAMVRPAGGVLPGTPQVLRTGVAGEDVAFVTGGPAGTPPITFWQDGASRSPFRVKLEGDLFTSQSPVFEGTYSLGRFPRYARCPDGTVVFSYQYTVPNPPSPTTYYSQATTGQADGKIDGGGNTSTQTPDYYQDPQVTCDRGVKLFSTAVDGDDHQGADLPERLRVVQLGVGGGTVLDRTLSTGNAYAGSPESRVAPDGRVWLLWSESPSTGGNTKSYLATRAPGATGAATVNPTPIVDSATVYPSGLFFDAAGNTHMLIAHQAGMGTSSYGVRTAPLGSATFGPEQEILPSGNHYAQLLTDHPDGNPRLLVTKPGPAPDYRPSYELRGIPQAGSGNAVTPIAFDGQFATSTFLPTGDLVIVGVHDVSSSPAPSVVRLVEGGLDTGAPPTIDGVDVPGLAAAGEATTIGVSAKDPMGLGSFEWTVRGGALSSPITLTTQRATIPGLSPGSYEVKARAVDRVGNAAEVTRTLRVLDPNAVTPGTAAFAEAVAKAGGTLTPPAVDKTAPSLSKITAVRGRSGKAKRSVTVAFTSSEASSADLELLGTLKRGGQQGTLVLKSGRLASLTAGKAGRASLAIPASLAKLVGGKLKVRITVTDLAGNRVQQTVSVTVAKR